MSVNTLKTRVKHAYKTESEWSSSNPTLLAGEIAYSSDKNNKYKIGNGTSTWSQLAYVLPTKEDIGLGEVENKSSETIRGELTKDNVTTALGYTPPTTNTTYDIATTSTNGLMSYSDKNKLNCINIAFCTCNDSSTSADKTVVINSSGKWELKVGSIIVVKFAYSNSASNVTLNVNGSGPIKIYYGASTYNGNSPDICGSSYRHIMYMYSGNYWVWLSSGFDKDTTYSTGTPTKSGLTKLYSSTGTSTDGAMSRNATTSAITTAIEDIAGDVITEDDILEALDLIITEEIEEVVDPVP